MARHPAVRPGRSAGRRRTPRPRPRSRRSPPPAPPAARACGRDTAPARCRAAPRRVQSPPTARRARPRVARRDR
ncbi:MAG: hypothetical protein E6J60_07810 [Deltaproteobacteria bacterium]|nr:MAG: hypothetical protein E6J60_07810 [Deltaproteobacteria bacterium]